MARKLDSILKRNKFFSGSDHSKIPFSNLNAELFSITEGRMLFKKGTPSDFIYFVQSGEINHFIDDTSGSTQIIVIEENDFIVDEELLFSDKYLSSAIAMRDSLLIKVAKDEITNLISAHPELSRNISNKISGSTEFVLEQPPLDYSSSSNELEIDFSEMDLGGSPVARTEDDKKEIFDFKSDDIFEKVNTQEHFSVIEFSDVSIVIVNITDATMQYAPEIKTLLIKLVSDEVKKIVVELNYCEMIDSTFLGALVLSLKKMNISKGELRLVCGNKPAWMIFEMTGMSKVFNTFSNLDDAMDGFYQS